ncbi:MAG: TonB-dependent receptor [Acidobacteria bacterium]|nr:TonB-dependent receptor [Acidobacteriota bacterium]MCB9397326.1 TonB-dependent receptor [Acidobacteriota bacterium]
MKYFFLLISSLAVWAGTLTGKVTSESGQPLAGASLEFLGPQEAKTTSNKTGAYSIELAPGKYSVLISLTGHVPVNFDLNMGDGAQSQDFAIQLNQYEEMTVISASKIETRLLDAPASVSVISERTLENAPSTDYGDLLRTVPGINAIKSSARDINITARQSSSTLANTQLALIDGRTIYQDFFGFILWDFLPTNPEEIKQIEVIRGPASAVWGANALTGVVNVITKSPREMEGTIVNLSALSFDREVDGTDLGSGSGYGLSVTHAQVLDSTKSFRVSLGYFEQDALARPVGTVPYDAERGTGGFPYPPFQNNGTSQPKLDFRFDQELNNGARMTYGLGMAYTEGIIHTGIGPFDIDKSSLLGYAKVSYEKEAFKAHFFINHLDGEAVNLLSRDTSGNPLNFIFKNDTYDLELSHFVVAGNHMISYGGNLRTNQFDLSLAPGEDTRDEYGAYVQDEISLNKFRLVLGGRGDKFDNLDGVVFSPRFALMYQPNNQHTVRLSYNRAFRSPAMVQNYLDVQIISASLDLGLIDPRLAGQIFPIVTGAFGNPDLKEEQLDAYELSYTANFGKSLFTFAYYINEMDDNINFTNPPDGHYTSQNPPPGWPLPPQVIDLLALQGIVFPSYFQYRNLGPIRYQGFETSLDTSIGEAFTLGINYSWQDDPEILKDANPYPPEEIINASKHRANLSLGWHSGAHLVDLVGSYASEAFWTDVLDARFHGPTDSYTQINVAYAYRWFDGLFTTTLKVNNLFDEEIQQHVFGDVQKRQFAGEVKFKF